MSNDEVARNQMTDVEVAFNWVLNLSDDRDVDEIVRLSRCNAQQGDCVDIWALAKALAAYKSFVPPPKPLQPGESLNLGDENYVGHIRAVALGAPCLCKNPAGLEWDNRDINCPYHGR